MLKKLVFLSLLGGWGVLPLHAAEKLGPDGFPADWKAEDFQLVSTTLAAAGVSAAAPVSGAAVYRIDQLPKVKSDIIQPLEHKTAEPSPSVPEVKLPAVEEEEVGAAPKTLKDLNNYGPLSLRGEGGKPWASPLLGARGVVHERAPVAHARSLAAQGGAPVAHARAFASQAGRRQPAVWVINDAYRRVLLSRAEAPAQAVVSSSIVSGTVVSASLPVASLPVASLSVVSVPVSASQPWLATRAEALEAMGFYEAADGLWRAVGPEMRLAHPALAEGWAASRLLAGQTGEACQLAGNQVLNSGDDAAGFWRQAVLACQAIAGQRNALGLSLQLPDAARADPFLLAVAAAVRDDRAVDEKALGKPGVPGSIGPLPAAILAAYPALIAEDWLPRLPDVVWRRLVRTEGLPWKLRAAAAELLAAQTRSDADLEVLQAFYAVVDAHGIDWMDPLGSADKVHNGGEPVRARALLWRAANGRAGTMGLRAQCWQRFALRASVAGLGSLLPHMSPDRANIKPAAELAWLAPLAQSLAWQRGDSADEFANTDWLEALRQNASVAASLKTEAQWLAVQAGLMAGKVENAAWQDWLSQPGWNAADRLRAARLLGAASGLGLALPSALMPLLQQKVGEFDETVAGARPLWAQTVDTAVAAGQVGTALDVLRQLGPGEELVSPPILTQAVNTLHDLKLEDEARRLAAAALMPPLLNEEASPPAPKIEAGIKPVEKGQKLGGTGSIALPPVAPVSPATVRTKVTPSAGEMMLTVPEKR